MSVGISIGWRCDAAVLGVEFGLRDTKQKGYLTCPFDICVSNYIGVCKCIGDDFKYFCDPQYLVLKKEPRLNHILCSRQTEDQYFIYNTYYNFAFNHESPGHGNLYLTENWAGGINHFVNNNFEKFIERYNNRINNFRSYLNSGLHVNFLLLRYNSLPYEFENIIIKKYPNLKFNIYVYVSLSNATNLVLHHNEDGAKEFDIAYLNYCCIDEKEFPEEFTRYNKPFNYSELNNNNITSENEYIKILS